VDFADDGASFRVRRERQLAGAEPHHGRSRSRRAVPLARAMLDLSPAGQLVWQIRDNWTTTMRHVMRLSAPALTSRFLFGCN